MVTDMDINMDVDAEIDVDTDVEIHYVHAPVCDRVRVYVHIYGVFTCEFYLIPDNLQHLNLTPQSLKFTDTKLKTDIRCGATRSVPHMCAHFSDSSTKWPPSERLFHHTDFSWTDRTFCIAVSFTNKVKNVKNIFRSSFPDGSDDTSFSSLGLSWAEQLLFKGTVAWDWDGLKVIILDRSVLEEEPLVVFKFFKCFFEF